MRNRTPRVDDYQPPSVYWNAYHNGQPFVVEPGYLYSWPLYSRFAEQMQDDIGHSASGNQCIHYKRSVEITGNGGFQISSFVNGDTTGASGIWANAKGYVPLPFAWGSVSDPNAPLDSVGHTPHGRFGWWTQPDNGCAAMGYGSAYLPAEIYNLHLKAFKAMMPGIEPTDNVSLLNSIYELKDFKTLPRTLNNIRNALKQPLLSNLVKSPTRTLRSLLHSGSDGYLQTQFNLLPLLSDIVAVKRAIAETRKKLNKLVSEAGKTQRRHYQAALTGPYTDMSDSVPMTGPGYQTDPSWNCFRSVKYSAKRYNATLGYSYILPDWITKDSLGRALMDAMGVNLNPRIIWNAIPWSFVVDWVINVNGWLDNLRYRNIEPVVYLREASWSVKLDRVINTVLSNGASAAGVITKENSYFRGFLPDPLSLVATSGLSPKEIRLSVALAATR